MPKGTNQKLKLYYLSRIMLELTDEDHGLTIGEIIRELEKYGVTAERKTLYKDLEQLNTMGMDVECEQQGRKNVYRVTGRLFELPELKLLVDAIQSSRFITERKSRELIHKLEGMASRYEAKDLQRQVYVSGRIKTMNESIYYNVDAIYKAIAENSRIRFRYFQWNVRKETELRHGGKFYEVSPWGLLWENENYYLIAYDADASMIKHYRVDKMLSITMTSEKREGADLFRKFDPAQYAKKNFGMYGGREERVRLRVKNELAGVMIDRFGKDVRMIPGGDGYFTAFVDVAVSGQFLGWVFALGDGAEITGPDSVKEYVKNEIRRLHRQYGV